MAEGVNFQIDNEFCNRIYGGLFINIGLLHLISVPDPPAPVRNYRFFLTLKIGKIAFTPEDFHKMWAYPWRIWVYPWRISWKLKLNPQRIQYFFTLPLKKSSIFITYPWRIPWFLNRGVRILSAIAHCGSSVGTSQPRHLMRRYRIPGLGAFVIVKRLKVSF